MRRRIQDLHARTGATRILMTTDQAILFTLIALVLGALLGVVPKDGMFAGFGHPAVIIVALVLVVSRGLARSGAIELLARRLVVAGRSLRTHVGIMSGVSAALSCVMNNVAALALLMPMEIEAARKAKRSPALTLMPLSFASILGGMVTLIGTPPNIVVATFREDLTGDPFRMFDFAPVGLIVALAGVTYLVFIGWRLIPADRTARDVPKELSELEGYVADAKVPEASEVVGKLVRDLDETAEANDVVVLGLSRRGKRLPGGARREEIRANDLLILQGGPSAIEAFVGACGLEYVGSEKHDKVTSSTLTLAECVVPVGSRINERTAMDVRLLYRKGVTLLGISRKGRAVRESVRKARVRAGDILLLYGPEELMPDVIDWLGCLPLAKRGLEVVDRRKSRAAVATFAVAILAASLGLVYLPVALAAVVVAYVSMRIVPISQLYDSVEWPVLVLLGSMIPLASALEASGATSLLAAGIIGGTSGLPTIVVLAIVMIVTMTLSDVLNNVATALIAAPVAVDVAQRLDANPDTFLMAVAVAASCAFLTPIGHKNNTIILGPGGYRFGDYWRMGLPLEILVIVVSLPALLLVWPL